jgi:hypothetical protein
VRLGTPALTTLGFSPAELDEVADVIVTALRATTPAAATAKAKVRAGFRGGRGRPAALRRPAGPAPPLPRNRALTAVGISSARRGGSGTMGPREWGDRT